MKFQIFEFYVLFLFSYTLPRAYVYPVVPLDDANVLMCYQPNAEHLELHAFNTGTKNITKMVSSLYNTAAVRLLPDNSGISFVDDGMVRIKRFATRSIKTVEIFAPIYGIEFVEWLDSTTCYFHALSDGFYGIYTLSLEETIVPIVAKDGIDCMYPQIIESVLYYIQRCKDKHETYYSVHSRQYKDLLPIDRPILTMNNKPIMFLKFFSLTEGFFLEYYPDGATITFMYHQLTYNSPWRDTLLFSFALPTNFFSDSPDRFYESIMPFIPRHINGLMYYSSKGSDDSLCLYAYDIKEGTSTHVGAEQDFLFAPVRVGTNFVIGSMVAQDYVQEPIMYYGMPAIGINNITKTTDHTN